MSPLERQLEAAMLDLYEKWKLVGPPRNYFLQMVRKGKNTRIYKGPVGTVRHLLVGEPSTGFRDLVKAGKSSWTVESLILEPKWKSLFSDFDRAKAKARLDSV